VDIQEPRFGRLVQALFNLKQRLTLGQALPDVMPTLSIDNPRPEMEIFSGNDLCGGMLEVPAVAAQLGFGVLRNPTSSGRLVILEQIIVTTAAAAGAYKWGINTAGSVGAAGVQTPLLMDTRRTPLGSANALASVCQMLMGSSAASLLPNAIQEARAVANSTYTFNLPGAVVLQPGTYVLVERQTANEAFQVSFAWRERAMGAQESVP